jgi:hypothetical protein
MIRLWPPTISARLMILSNGRQVPELTCSADNQLNKRVPLRSRRDDLGCTGQLSPKSRSIPAKPPGDHIPSGGFVLERASMANYRIVIFDNAGKLSGHHGFVCDNDDDATIVWAKHSVDDAPVELWRGARFVARLEPRSKTKA